MEDQVDEKPAVAGGVDDWKKRGKKKEGLEMALYPLWRRAVVGGQAE